FVVLGAVALVVSQRRKENSVAEQLLFDAEKYRPHRAVVSVSHQVAGMEDEIGSAMLDDRLDHPAMHVVASPRVAVNHEMVRLLSRGRSTEASLFVGVSG